MANIFEIIKSIQKTDRSILPHAEKNLLVSIAIHLGENGHIWPTNEQMGERIGENKDYIKNLLMRLKNKGFIIIEGRGKKRQIKIIEDKIFGNSQLPNHANGNSQLPVGNSQLPNSVLPIKRKEKNNIKEKMLPQGIFLKKYRDKIPPGIEGKFKNSQLDEYYEKYGDEFLRICIESKKIKLLQRARYIQGTITKLENKEAMKYEQAEIDQNEQHKTDLAIIAERFQGLASMVGHSI